MVLLHVIDMNYRTHRSSMELNWDNQDLAHQDSNISSYCTHNSLFLTLAQYVGNTQHHEDIFLDHERAWCTLQMEEACALLDANGNRMVLLLVVDNVWRAHCNSFQVAAYFHALVAHSLLQGATSLTCKMVWGCYKLFGEVLWEAHKMVLENDTLVREVPSMTCRQALEYGSALWEAP